MCVAAVKCREAHRARSFANFHTHAPSTPQRLTSIQQPRHKVYAKQSAYEGACVLLPGGAWRDAMAPVSLPTFMDPMQLARVANFLGIVQKPKSPKPLRVGVLGASQASSSCKTRPAHSHMACGPPSCHLSAPCPCAYRPLRRNSDNPRSRLPRTRACGLRGESRVPRWWRWRPATAPGPKTTRAGTGEQYRARLHPPPHSQQDIW
jgi:hypothetical protein